MFVKLYNFLVIEENAGEKSLQRQRCGAEAGSRTPMGLRPLSPEPSVSTNFTTSALKGLFVAFFIKYVNCFVTPEVTLQ